MLKICFYTNFDQKMRKTCENAILDRFLACPGFFFQANPPKLMDSLIFWSYWAKKLSLNSIPCDDLFSYPINNSYINKSGDGIKGSPMSRHKWWKMAKMAKNWIFRLMTENGEVVVWSSSLPIDIIATAPSDNSYVSKSRGGIKGSPMSRHKWWKMAKNGQKLNFQGNGGRMRW